MILKRDNQKKNERYSSLTKWKSVDGEMDVIQRVFVLMKNLNKEESSEEEINIEFVLYERDS